MPALVATLPAAHAWAANFDEVTATDAGIVIGLLLAVGAVVHVLVAAVCKPRLSASSAALIATLVNSVLFCVLLIAERMPLRFRFAVALLVGAALLAVIHIWRTPRDRSDAAWVTALATIAIAVSLAIGPVIGETRERSMLARVRSVPEIGAPIVRLASSAGPARPDIYLFLLDNYGSPEMLAAEYGVRSDWFSDSLRTLGFRTPSTRANYSHTSLALASLLNVAYLDSVATTVGEGTSPKGVVYELIRSDRVTAFLEEAGYHSYVVPSVPWIGTLQHSRADVHFTTERIGAVRGQWIRGLLLYVIWPRTLVGRMFPDAVRWSSREKVLAAFAGVAQLIDRPEPKFVLMHSMAAHYPFTVGPDCASRDSIVSEPETQDSPAARAYVDGLECTNRQVLGLVEEILRRSKSAPVILVMGDHGPQVAGTPWRGDASAITAAQARLRLSIIGAYHLPDAAPVLPDTVTPVNVMRTVLSHYLDADLPALENRSFHSTGDNLYRFVDIPDSVFHEPGPGSTTIHARVGGEAERQP